MEYLIDAYSDEMGPEVRISILNTKQWWATMGQRSRLISVFSENDTTPLVAIKHK